MNASKRKLSRRQFLRGAAAASATFTIVPRHVLGGHGQVPPSDTFGAAASGVLKDSCKGFYIKKGGFKVKEWSGKPDLKPEPVPKYLDWDMYCGPSPLKPFVRERYGGTHRNYWDYEGGGLSDMGQHFFDPVQWIFAK